MVIRALVWPIARIMSSEQGSGQELNRDTEDNDDGHRRASDQWKSPTPNEAQSTRIFGSDLNNSHVLSNTCSGRDEIDDPSWCAMKPMDDVGLLYHNREPLRLKDFATEVRAPMDVEQFAHQAELLLDPSTVSMGEIVTHMLEKVSRCLWIPSSARPSVGLEAKPEN